MTKLPIYLQKQLVERAIARSGSIALLARALGVSEKSVRRWWHGGPMRIASIAKLRTFAEG